MKKEIFKNKFWFIIILCFMFMLPSANVFSQHRGRGGQGGGHGGRGWHGGHQGNWRNWGYHHPRGYHWYSGSWWFGDALIQSLVIGATLSSLPPSYRVVYVGRAPYYYDGVYYYKPYRSGYVVVEDPTIAPVVVAPPVVVQPAPPTINIQPQAEPGGTITINVPNSKGEYTAVQLTKYGNGYLGPQGEFYSGNPTVDQLKALYGR